MVVAAVAVVAAAVFMATMQRQGYVHLAIPAKGKKAFWKCLLQVHKS